MATVPFVVLAGDAGTWPRRVLLAIVAAVVAGGILLATSSAALLDVLGNIRTGTVYKPPLPPLAPLVTVAVVVAVYALLVPRRWLALPAGIAVVAMLLTSHAFAATWIWQQAYERIYLTLPVVAAVAVVPSGWLRRDWLAAPLAIGLGLVWVGIGWPIVTDRTTDHLEYRWVRDELREIPLECRIVHLAFAGEHALLLPTYVPVSRQAVAMDARQPRTIESALAPGPCLYYVHSSLCSTPEGRPECEAIERRLTLVPVARASFPPGREFDAPVHEGDSVETVIARVEGVLEPDDR
jgi:hypothetical protein